MNKKNIEINNHQEKENFIKHVIHKEKDFEKKVKFYQVNLTAHFPFLFLTLSTFGAIMLFYGFEKIIDRVPYLANNPLFTLCSGLFLLILTGALYKKLGE